jgi:hypothetical protein
MRLQTFRAASDDGKYDPYDFVGNADPAFRVEFTFTRRAILRRFRKPSVCVAIVILGFISASSGQRSEGVLPRRVSPDDTTRQRVFDSRANSKGFENVNDETLFNGSRAMPYRIDNLNGAINAGLCGLSARPAWCRGSDIGAWANSAIALVRCGEVFIPAGTYTQTTSIVKPRCVKLHGASARSTILRWIPRRGAAIIMGDGVTENFAAQGAVEDLTLVGPGASTKTCGIYLGGSDGTGCAPSTAIDPSAYQDDHDNINRVTIYKSSPAGAFGVGIQWGYNAWSNTIFESDIAFNGTGIYVPHTLTATGENLSILNSTIQNNLGIGLKVGTGNNINFTLVNTSLDYNGSWAVQNGTSSTQNAVSLVNCYLAQTDHWLQNYGYMNLSETYANDGTNSGTLGYLIDNEAPFMTVTGGQFFNSGTGAILNPAGVGSTWIAPLVTNPGANGLTPTMTYIDRLGDFAPSALYTNIVNQNVPNRLAGTSACSSGTQTITFAGPYVSAPVVLLFDETTKGGINLTMKANWGFTASCTGAADVFDWIVIGNPN